MRTIVAWLTLALLSAPVWSAEPVTQSAPAYTAASIVNSASNSAQYLCPNTLATIYGKELSFFTAALRPQDVASGQLPSELAHSGVTVLVNNLPASLYYVSPGQINFLVPPNLRPGPTRIQVVRQGLVGNQVVIDLKATAPAVFQASPTTLLAAHGADNSPVTAESPAKPGEVLILYAVGLGATIPPAVFGRIATGAAKIALKSDLALLLDGKEVPKERILYAGVTPGFGGLYQINLRLPDDVGPNPELIVWMLEQSSPGGLRLPVAP